jgi:hypothetical protein
MIDLTITLNPSIDGLSLPPFSSGRLQVFQTAEGGGNPGEVTVPTTEITISFGTVVPGLVLLYNLDTTNFVEWGTVTTVYDWDLLPRLSANSKAHPHILRPKSGTSIFMRANTAPCKVLILGYND